ncbi:MAG: rod-binding protein [bacterium]|nr:rod-binding protein [bacterium]
MNPLSSSNPLQQSLFSGGAASHLRRDTAPEILTRAARQQAPQSPNRPAGPQSAVTPGAAKAAEFARYFPGAAAGRSGAEVSVGAPPNAGISSAQLSSSANIQREIDADPERKRLYNAALDFQGIFIGKMLKSMRSNLNPENDLLFGGNRQQIFEDMLYDEYSKAMSRSGGFDLADQMYQQLSAKLPPVGVPDAANNSAVSNPAAGRLSTGEVQAASGTGSSPDGAREQKARKTYDAHSNRISTEQLWNENDWRP